MALKTAGTRQRLIKAAEHELIANNGSMEISAVAKRAKVSAGLTYHHFGSKTGLVSAVVNHFYEPLRAIALGDEIPLDLEWQEREHIRTKSIIDYYYWSPMAPLISGRLAREPDVIDMERAHMNALLEAGARNIAQGQRLGVISREFNPQTVVAMLMGGLRLAIDQAITADKRPPKQELLDELWKFMSQALNLEQRNDIPTADQPGAKSKTN